MTVILRVFLVVGVMTYFAAQQRPGGAPATAPDRPERIATTSLTAAWGKLSAGARDEIARAGAVEIERRLSATKVSQDTLLSSDKRAAWRGSIE